MNIKTTQITHIILAILAALSLFLPLSGILSTQSVSAQADPQNKLCKGVDELKLSPTGHGGCKDSSVKGSGEKLDDLITTAINIFSVIVGIIAVVMLIYGGLRYITSAGDSGRLTGAKQTIIYAIIGLIIVAFAQFVARFIVSKAAEVSTS